MDTGAAWRRWLLDEVRSAGRRLRALEERLDEATLCRHGLVGAWSGTELLVHLARWDEATVAVVRAHLAGTLTTEELARYDDEDALNAVWAAEDAGVSVARARRRLWAAHNEVDQLLAGLEPGRWDDLVRHWASASVVVHYRAHGDALVPLVQAQG